MKFVFFIILAVFLNAAYIVKINKVEDRKIELNQYVKKGMSGIVLCPYNGEKIICAKVISYGNYAKLSSYKNLKNDAFALPIVYPKSGDIVVFGKDYARTMIIAPNQDVYLKLKEKMKNFIIIPSDVFAAFLDKMPSKKSFIRFANKMDIGIYVFVLDKIYYVDSNSFYVINSQDLPFEIKDFKLPFYSSYNFDLNKKNPIKYYKNLLKGLND